MNILLINHYAGSPRHGMEFRPYYLAREWILAGHNVTIVAGGYSHIRAQQPEFPSGGVLDEVIDGISYRWYPTPKYSGNGIGRVRSIVSFLWYLWRDTEKLIFDVKPDVVIASSTYPMDIWPARFIAKRADAGLIYEVHDLWPLSPIELGGMSRWHPFIIWTQMAEDYAYKHADRVVSILPKTLEYMRSRGLDSKKFAYIPNGVDESEWQNPEELPPDISQPLDRIQQLGRPIVGYAGTYGVANALDDLLDAAKLLKGQVEIVLVGTGPERARLWRRVQQEGLLNVHMFTSVPKKTMPNLLKIFDIAYIGLQPQPLFRFGISPNKLIDYMYASKVILMAVEAGNNIVGEVGCGITVRPGDIKSISKSILDLAGRSAKQRQAMGRLGRKFIVDNQTYPMLAQRFTEVMISCHGRDYAK